MRIGANQNVGIGTNNPSARLDVRTTSSTQATFTRTGQSAVCTLFQSTADTYLSATNSGANLILATQDTERMRVDSSGNIGIGAASGGAALNIERAQDSLLDLNSTSTFNPLVQFKKAGTRFAYIQPTVNALNIAAESGTGNRLAFITGTTERMRVTDFGLTIGETTSTYKLNVVGGAASAGLRIRSGGNGGIPIIDAADTNGNGSFSIDAAGNMYLSSSYAQKASGTTWANPSDIRIKDNIVDYTKGLNELTQVNVKTWEYNGKANTTAGTKGLGVVADEIMQVLPETVDTYKTKLNVGDEIETDIKRFDATEITWLLVKAIQEQQEIITDLKSRIEILEAN
jgi:hypothetical protein